MQRLSEARERLKSEASITKVEEAIGAARSAPAGLARILDAPTVAQLASSEFLHAMAERMPALRRFPDLEGRKLAFGARAGKPPREFSTKNLRKEGGATARGAVGAPAAAVNWIASPWMPPVRDQGIRWTCVAFATCAVVEFAYRRQGDKFDGSEQFQYWDTKQNDPDGYTSLGTWPAISFDRMIKTGVCPETAWRYNRRKDPPQNDPAGPHALPLAATHRVRQAVTLRDPRDIPALQSRLRAEGPLAIAIPVFKSWAENAAVHDSGNIGMPLPGEQPEGGHAIVLVGYATDPDYPGGGYFLLRNSYGRTWGAECPFGKGYGTIPFEFVAQHNYSAFFVRL